jgi:hypothetical protein
VAQPGSALVWGTRGRGFESRHSDQIFRGTWLRDGAVSVKISQPSRFETLVVPILFTALFVALSALSATTYEFPYTALDEHAHVSFAAYVDTHFALLPDFDAIKIIDFKTHSPTNIPDYINHTPIGYFVLNALNGMFGVSAASAPNSCVRFASLVLFSSGYLVTALMLFRQVAVPLIARVGLALVPLLLQLPLFGGFFSNDSLAFLGGSLAVAGSMTLLNQDSDDAGLGLAITLIGLLFAVAAKLTAALLVGIFVAGVVVVFALQRRGFWRTCLKPLPLLLVAVIAVTSVPYLLFIIKYGSPAPNTPGQILLLQGGDPSRVLPLPQYLWESLLGAISNAGTGLGMVSAYALFFAITILATLFHLYQLVTGRSRADPIAAVAVAAGVATALMMLIQLTFSYDRHVTYGWQVELYPRYYFPLMGAYLLALGGFFNALLSQRNFAL